ncbi:MAG: M15 family metallopeptidase [Oscillospiraceae bacterium]|nr:M15 family metallopeptidase [Oscillospiraceae bacterium]
MKHFFKNKIFISTICLAITSLTTLFFINRQKQPKDTENSNNSPDESNEEEENKEEPPEEKESSQQEQPSPEEHKPESQREEQAPSQNNNSPQNQAWALILVNKQHGISQDFGIQTTKIDGIDVDVRIAPHVLGLIKMAKSQDINLGLCSGYRSIMTQNQLFQREVDGLIAKGYSRSKAEEEASRSVAPPGTSEHHTGLAIDCYSNSQKNCNLVEAFANTSEGKFIKENGSKFGFILRYPKGKEHITGYIYEPWHLRYVGEKVAEEITKSGKTLEEHLAIA